ncbi:His Kinase A (phospho-acceptor) domain-containing protein [Spirosomataceae bacterium TFI 002]|nr:His Kinase A (phospho-acceptor) domain-containing protein [Spirosomataceae bacterium TFI 002]
MISNEFDILNALQDPVLVVDPEKQKLVFRNSAAISLGFEQYEQLDVVQLNISDRIFSIDKRPSNGLIVLHLKDVTTESELNKEFDDFVRIASHDLREPARKIANFGDRLKAELYNDLAARPKMYLDRMLASSERMQQMLSELLLLSRIKLKGEKEDVDLSKIIKEQASEKGIDLVLKSTNDKKFEGELQLIVQLLDVLLDNAMKFKKEAEVLPKAEINVDFNKSKVVITLHDNGIGMNVDDFAEARKPFVRLNGRSEFPGSGMGLAIASKILKVLDGNMKLLPTDEGSKIEVVIPVS